MNDIGGWISLATTGNIANYAKRRLGYWPWVIDMGYSFQLRNDEMLRVHVYKPVPEYEHRARQRYTYLKC